MIRETVIEIFLRIEKMTAIGEVENPAVVQRPTEASKVKEQASATEKAVKEKKPRAPKEKKPKSAKAVTHPPYFQVFFINSSIDKAVLFIIILPMFIVYRSYNLQIST